ncbi:cobalamin biosynthesis protein [Pannonibacter phragmitetus]|uniref:CobW family GTP-binding protein n=1 Tax=Pannonibacter phragmitetus TaxID=121719 RepID=UPI00067D3F77|nr:GTP-binding protein [Pannonibacter phragmitetus]KND16335.1 cobalamin biosynthesis protein [Pannonibacter phragmitetus]
MPKITQKIPVIVLTGFLGSGKSTLLQELLTRENGQDTAVIINEFGEVPIDHDLVRVGRGELMRTSTGCLCCTAGADVRATLYELYEAVESGDVAPFSRVIIETTGLADPAPLVNQLVAGAMPAMGLRDHVVARHFVLAGVVTTVDIITGEITLENHFEAAKQVAFADRIVLTKTDLAQDPASKRDIALLAEGLRQLNPAAELIDRHGEGVDLDSLFVPRNYQPASLGEDVLGWLAMDQAVSAEGGHAHGKSGLSRHAARVNSFVLTSDIPFAEANYRRFMDVLVKAAGPRLLRVKGLIALEDAPDKPLVIHAVQHAVFPAVQLEAWPSEDRRGRLVFITDELEEKPVRDLFEAVLVGRPSAMERLRNAIGLGPKPTRDA